MRFFLRSRRFKIICAVTAALLIVSIVIRIIGGTIAPHSSIIGAIAQPFRSVATFISNEINDFSTKLNEGAALLEENNKLQDRIDELSSQVVEYDEIKKENEFLKEFYNIKEEHDDFMFLPATLISRDNSDPGYTFTINKGSVNGVSYRDPVITSSGLVGYISEVGPSYSKVTTILSSDMSVGCVDYRTSDVGVVTGDPELSKNGQSKFYNLPRSCTVALNDIIVTAGGGIFPEGIVVGTINSISSYENQTSITATIDCAADILDLRDVMVITYFEGQGSITTEGEE